MHHTRPPLLLLAALLGLAQCHTGSPNPDPVSQLPAATQTGARTFGCLVNGQVFIPSGNNGTSNFWVIYDPGTAGATINIHTYCINSNGTQYVILSCGPVKQTRAFSLNIPVTEGTAGYVNTALSFSCSDYSSNTTPTYRKGQLLISKLDPTNGIVAGTFDFTVAQPGCDTIKVTQGRFDAKF